MGEPNERDLELLRHMLGIDKPHLRDPEPYRNYFDAGEKDQPDLASMAERGLVEHVPRQSGPFAGHWYRATDLGIRLARESSRRRAWPKAKRVYDAFLRVSDCCPDLTFKAFLTSADFAEARRSA